MKQAKFLTIVGDKMLTKFMSACDVFEKGKVLGEMQEMTISFKEDTKMSLNKISLHKYILLESLEKCDKIVSFIHLLEIQDGDKIIKNNKILPYVNKEVRVISNGEKWFLFANYLKYLNIPIETDQYMFITNVGKTKKLKK